MRLLCTFFVVALAICHAHPGDEFGGYVYPSYLPEHHGEDFARHFHYKEYFPTPPEIGVGSGYHGSVYAGHHVFPPIGDQIGEKVHHISSAIGDQLNYKAHAIKEATAAVSHNIGGKISSGPCGFCNEYHHEDPYAYGFGYSGHDKLGEVAQGVGDALSGSVAVIKHVGAEVSDNIGHKVQAVRDGIGEQLSNAAHTIQEVQAGLTDHLSRSAVHVSHGISGVASDTTHTAQNLYGILTDLLGKNAQVIGEGFWQSLRNTGHALSASNAAIYQHFGKKAYRIGEFFQGKAHELDITINKKILGDHVHVPEKIIEPVKPELPVYAEKAVELDAPYPGAYGFQQPAQLFQPNKAAVAPIPIAPEPYPGAPAFNKI